MGMAYIGMAIFLKNRENFKNFIENAERLAEGQPEGRAKRGLKGIFPHMNFQYQKESEDPPLLFRWDDFAPAYKVPKSISYVKMEIRFFYFVEIRLLDDFMKIFSENPWSGPIWARLHMGKAPYRQGPI